MSGPGIGSVATDGLDASCKSYKACLKCAIDEFGDSCTREFNNYSTEESDSLRCTDSAGSCEKALCECDKHFAESHASEAENYDHGFNQISGGFKYLQVCREYKKFDSCTINCQKSDRNVHFDLRKTTIDHKKKMVDKSLSLNFKAILPSQNILKK